MKKIFLPSPCKINLHLDVGARRPDGFHNLKSIFHLVSLHDLIEIAYEESTGMSQVFLDLIGVSPCPPEKNIAYLAAHLFLKEARISATVKIRLEKRIPAGAGLGGGSSNAAAILLGLNSLSSRRLSEEKLNELAATLGSDVPFFLMGGAALVTGRGEFVSPLTPCQGLPILIVVAPVHVSTGEAFALLDDQKAYSDTLSDSFLDSYLSSDIGNWNFFNSFQGVISAKYSEISNVIDELKVSGAQFVSMSGSGSAVYAIYENEKLLKKAKKRLKNDLLSIYAEKTIEKFINCM